ncbi:uncharacterized protein LOC142772072 isoform X3 [Rhipicephalus microplus]
MLEKEFCTTPSVQEYELAHYRRHRYVVSDDDGSSAEPKSSPQQLCLCERAGGARSSVLARSLQDNENQQQVGFVTENKVTPTSGQSHRPQRNASSKEQLDSTFRVLGPAGRISPPGMVIEPYFLGDSVTQISPTTFAFSRRRQQIAAPLSDADLATLARRSSSTTTFSDEDFQISYHKVLESSVASWLGDDDADDILGGTRSRYRQRRDADRVPSVELPSIRATHKTKSEQLTTRASGVEDVAVQRPRSEDLSVHMREPQPVALRHLETSIVQGALRSLHGQSRADSDAERLVIASRVGFGSSPAGLPQTSQPSANACDEDDGPGGTPCSESPSKPPPVTPPPPPPRVAPVEKPPRGNHRHRQASADQAVPRSPPSVKLCAQEQPAEEGRKSGSPSSPSLFRDKLSRSPSRSPRTSSFLQARTVRHERPHLPGRRTPSPPRSVNKDDGNEIAAAEYKLTIINACPGTAVAAGLHVPPDRRDKAVQVHIRTLDKRFVACSVLAGVLAIALVAVVLFAILER